VICLIILGSLMLDTGALDGSSYIGGFTVGHMGV
jgi:hypothetical protein